MSDFWDEWLGFWNRAQERRKRAKKVMNDEELNWIKTKQDRRVALLVAPETGFFTMGGVTMLVEIPVGWRTGKCSCGEVGIYILQGKGCSVIDGLRYDWEKGSTVWIPFGATFQHYNLGDEPVRFIEANAIHLENFVGIARPIQYEEHSETPKGEPKEPKAPSDILFRMGRIVLHAKDAPQRIAAVEERKRAKENGRHVHSRRIELMNTEGTGFNSREVEITTIMCDEAQGHLDLHPEKHAHMEAHVYVLQGEGYSIIDGERIPWKRGSMLHIQGPQTMHEHFNTGNNESQMLRIHFGIRAHFFEKIAERTFPYIGDKASYER